MRAAATTLVVALAVTLLVACGGGAGPAPATSSDTSDTPPLTTVAAPTTPAPTPTAPSVPPPATPPADRAEQVLATLDLPAQVGQLLMTGLRFGTDPQPTFDALQAARVGNVFLGGRSSSGVSAVAALTGRLQQAAPSGVALLVATDQEGGQVQVLSGPGFDAIPSGLTQGGLAPATLQADATRWGGQLAAAGVRVDLGPVLDTVAPGADNPPIGGYDRQYGSDQAAVSAHGAAFAAGLAAAGVAATGKHFPGLGRVTANTDTTARVVDTVTGADSPDLLPFRDAVAAGIRLVMMSSAVYSRLDGSQPAVFSPVVVTQLLRTQLGFGGVVVSDDLGNAAAVAAVSVGDRAVRFVAAGGDLYLDVDPGHALTAAAALTARAQTDPAFAARVRESALRVLRLKQSLGLLG